MLSIDEITKRAGHLPASEIASEVNDRLETNATLVVTAPPGAGKSTLLPLTILRGLADGGKVIMLEPRRLAARQIAERMADIMGEPVGRTVGYRVRFDTKASAATRVEVVTEGILTRMLTADPTLDGVSVVVFDEFHERSLTSDLALALTRQSQQIIRPDLKIVIMSATIDADGMCQALKAPLIESRGRMYPVTVEYAVDDCTASGIPVAAVSAIRKAHAEHDGDILVFLPGQGEIARCQEMLGDSLMPTAVCPLYGNLPPEQQRRAIAPSRDGERKVVLATPIAETSLTIEGVRIVIDSGFCRTLVFDPRTGLSHLETVRISKDMATQRTGRAGRVAEGVCCRLWTRQSEHRMDEQRKAEILDADLAAMLLDVAAFGENDVTALPWLTMPPKGNVVRARMLLGTLGALAADGCITPMGRRMAPMPCHPRISRMILRAGTSGEKALACDIAAVLEEKDPMGEESGCDLTMRISVMRRCRREKRQGRWSRICRIAEEYRRMVRVDADNEDVCPESVGVLVSSAYPERVAVATDNIGNYRLASGDSVRIDAADSMGACRWLAIASLNTTGQTGRVFLAAPVDTEDIRDLMTERDNVSWDSKELRVVMQHERRIGRLLIESTPIHDAGREEIIKIICEAVRKDGLSMFSWDESVQRLQRRVAKSAEWHPEAGFPDLSTGHLMETAAEWLPFYLENNGRMRLTAAELRKINLADVLWSVVPYDMQQEIDRIAPTHIQVPTGSRIRIDYRHGAEAPVVSVRLQECFGLEDTPCVNDGRQPVLMELLSPGFKPVQLTQDLRSFWQGTYFEVRKELRRRYPKHYWPENPLEAEAVRGVKRNK